MSDAKLSRRKKRPLPDTNRAEDFSREGETLSNREPCDYGVSDSSNSTNVSRNRVLGSHAPSWREILRIFHWGTLLAQFIITSISLTFLYVDTYFWPLINKHGFLDTRACLHLFLFCCSSVLTQYNFLMAIYVGPGYVPLKWHPEEKVHANKLQYCTVCEGYKVPRSHHCRSCDRCVMKMEHHCPWINNCVGHRNHAYFLRFLLFAVMGCSQALFVFLLVVCRIFNFAFTTYYYNQRAFRQQKTWYAAWARLFAFSLPPTFHTLPALLWLVVLTGFAVGVVLAVGALFIIQLRIILKNETSIESWILEKAAYYSNEEDDLTTNAKSGKRRMPNPYDIGWRRNLQQVIWNASQNPVSDGIWWDVRDNCDQFTLTQEQIRQKFFKLGLSVEYVAVRDYNGRIFPLFSQNLKTCITFPWIIDDPRLALRPGDVVKVTRTQKHWLYGSKVSSPENSSNSRDKVHFTRKMDEKGWFPRRAVTRAEQRREEITATED